MIRRDVLVYPFSGGNVDQSFQTQNMESRGQESELGFKRVRRGRNHRIIVGVGDITRYGNPMVSQHY